MTERIAVDPGLVFRPTAMHEHVLRQLIAHHEGEPQADVLERCQIVHYPRPPVTWMELRCDGFTVLRTEHHQLEQLQQSVDGERFIQGHFAFHVYPDGRPPQLPKVTVGLADGIIREDPPEGIRPDLPQLIFAGLARCGI